MPGSLHTCIHAQGSALLLCRDRILALCPPRTGSRVASRVMLDRARNVKLRARRSR